MLPKNLTIRIWIRENLGFGVNDFSVRNSLGVETTLKQFIPVNRGFTFGQVKVLVETFGGNWDSANGVYTYTVDCD